MGEARECGIPRELDGLRQNPPDLWLLAPTTRRFRLEHNGTELQMQPYESQNVVSSTASPVARPLRRKRGNVGLLRASTAWLRGLHRTLKSERSDERPNESNGANQNDRLKPEGGPFPKHYKSNTSAVRRTHSLPMRVQQTAARTRLDADHLSEARGRLSASGPRQKSQAEATAASDPVTRPQPPSIAIENDSWTCNMRDGVPLWEADSERHGRHETSQNRATCEICQVTDLLLRDESITPSDSDSSREVESSDDSAGKHGDGVLRRLRGRQSLRALTSLFNVDTTNDRRVQREDSPERPARIVNQANIGRRIRR